MVIEQEVSWMNYAAEFMFLLYDECTFFGFDEEKIHRIRGVPGKIWDKFTIKRYIVANIFIFVLCIIIMKKSIDTFQTVRSQELNINYKNVYTYDSKE